MDCSINSTYVAMGKIVTNTLSSTLQCWLILRRYSDSIVLFLLNISFRKLLYDVNACFTRRVSDSQDRTHRCNSTAKATRHGRNDGTCVLGDATETTRATWRGIFLPWTDASNAPPINHKADRIESVYVRERDKHTRTGPECLKAICVARYC